MKMGTPTTMEKLPEDVLSYIFIRLLVKQVAQMRCVCKSWNAFLSEPAFVKSHLHHSIQNNDGILLFFEHGFSLDRTFFTTHPSRSPNLELTNFVKIPRHPLCGKGFGSVIGSVNGLICFCYRAYSSVFFIGIWNPSLSRISALPPCPLFSHEVQFGFGFDPKTDDYKVVKLPSVISDKVQKTEVYSMRKGYWGSISQNFPSHITMCRDRNKVCLDGHLHWVCETNLEWTPDTILAFDLGTETFCEICLPDSIIDCHEDCYNALGVLSGKLSLMSCVRGGEFEVWVMDEYGVTESWVKHRAFPKFNGDIVPYGFTSHGEFLFQVGGGSRYDLYDPVAAKTKTFKSRPRSQFCVRIITENVIIEYVDSLVWIPTPPSRLQI